MPSIALLSKFRCTLASHSEWTMRRTCQVFFCQRWIAALALTVTALLCFTETFVRETWAQPSLLTCLLSLCRANWCSWRRVFTVNCKISGRFVVSIERRFSSEIIIEKLSHNVKRIAKIHWMPHPNITQEQMSRGNQFFSRTIKCKQQTVQCEHMWETSLCKPLKFLNGFAYLRLRIPNLEWFVSGLYTSLFNDFNLPCVPKCIAGELKQTLAGTVLERRLIFGTEMNLFSDSSN